VLIHKVKEQKGLEEYLRKIFQQDAFIFFTLDKLVLGLVKLVNNLNADSLTYKLLKEGVRDYDL
jgi:histone deacetylase complex regulatory component SIN3